MIYEIREYTTVPGRMQALIRRINEHVMKLLAKHGIECVFAGVTEVGENSNNEFVYVMRFDSYAEMDEKWTAYINDPEWVEAKAASEVDGPIIAQIRRRVINPTPFL
jgi:hypothetical protein